MTDLIHSVEPQFETERELEDAIASAIHVRLDADASIRAVLIRGFGLDLGVFTEKPELFGRAFLK